MLTGLPPALEGINGLSPRILPAITEAGCMPAITERISRAAEDAAREARRRRRRANSAPGVLSVGRVGRRIDAFRRGRPDIFGPQIPGPREERDGQGSDGGPSPPPGSPAPSDPPGVIDNFPEVHLVLLPNAEVAAFRQRRGVDDDRMVEHRVPGTEETLLCYSDSVEAWVRVTEISYILVLPRDGLLRLILTGPIKAPITSLVVFSCLSVLLFKVFTTYIPAHTVFNSFLLPVIGLLKLLSYYLLYALHVAFAEFGRLASYACGIAVRSARIFLVAVLDVTVQCLDDLRKAQLDRLAAL
ncbi:hypothetical protein NMY22_g10189 [Coprinellus aureogranulatus]|nr:hypothetical protein NMY22_g10189 [Coprinellus aureogranulatus]